MVELDLRAVGKVVEDMLSVRVGRVLEECQHGE